MWIKKGLIFDDHHAQLPVCDLLEDRIRVYYSTRIDGKSAPMFVDVDRKDPKKILNRSTKPLLDWGKPGSFDWSGVMPTEIINVEDQKWMYYIGWSRRLDVPYHNTLGLAISEDGGETWKKYSEGPVMSSSAVEPGYIGTVEIEKLGSLYRMWYLSCRDWIEHEGIMEPIYDIKMALSANGIDWKPTNHVSIPLEDNEGGISAARILKNESYYEMYFSVRDKTEYREDSEKSYRIKKAVSINGTDWERINILQLDTSDTGWDDFMVCYPEIVETGEHIFMFYNGNGFGKTGFGYAEKADQTRWIHYPEGFL